MGNTMICGAAPQMKAPITFSPVLNDNTWEKIGEASDKGIASSLWNVGDTKNITVDGVSYPVQIIGFNHDTKTDGGTAGITFQLVNCLNTTYQMNSSDTNAGGWESSAMRTHMDTFLSQLPSDLQSAIKAVNKLTSAGRQSATINTTSDKLFLLSEVEIFGSYANSFAGEGSQYAYYKAGNSKVKKVKNSASDWWKRSPREIDRNRFCYVDSIGTAIYRAASTSQGVSFAFCV